MKRRTFLHHFIRTTIIGGLLWQGWIFFRSLFSDISLQETSYFNLGTLEHFLEPITFIPEAKIFLFRQGNTLSAVSAVCTHLGCTVQLSGENSLSKQFHCPCHGSKYDVNGNVIHGPAKKALSWFELKKDVNSNELILKTDHKFALPQFLAVFENN